MLPRCVVVCLAAAAFVAAIALLPTGASARARCARRGQCAATGDLELAALR